MTSYLRLNLQAGDESIDFDRSLLKYILILLMRYEDGETEIDEDEDFRLEWPLWKWIKSFLSEYDRRYGTALGPFSMLQLKESHAASDIQLYDLYRMLRVTYHYECSVVVAFLMQTIVMRLLPLNEKRLTLSNPLLGRRPSLAALEEPDAPLTKINAAYSMTRELLAMVFTHYIDTFDMIDTLERHYVPRISSLLACGDAHIVLVTESEVLVRGVNTHGELGLGMPDTPANKWFTLALPSSPISVWCGAHHTIILTVDGLYGFGSNKEGQLGLENRRLGLNVFEPRRLATLPQVLSVACGSYHTLIHTTEHVYGCGRNEHGELSTPLEAYVFIPKIINVEEPVDAIAAGEHFSLFLGRSGTVYHCGLALTGIPVSTQNPMRVSIPSAKSRIVALVAGARHALFLDHEGRVYVWGANDQGQLGLGQRATWVSQVTQHPTLRAIVNAAAGVSHSLFVDSEGALYRCGSDALTPIQVTGVGRVISVASERSTTRILTCDGLYVMTPTSVEPRKEEIVRLAERPICQSSRRPPPTTFLRCHVCGKEDSETLHLHHTTQRLVCSAQCHQRYTQFRVQK